MRRVQKSRGSFNIHKRKRNNVVPGLIIAEKAAEVSVDNGLAAIDSIIYTTALVSNAELLTTDNDFRGLKDVKIIAYNNQY